MDIVSPRDERPEDETVLDDLPLQDEEIIIEGNRVAMIEIGLALSRIKEKEKWRQGGYASFAEYCQIRWGWGPHYANKVIALEAVAAQLHLMDEDILLPDKEAQARELYRLLPNPERLMQVWKNAVEAANRNAGGEPPRQPTAQGIRVARDADELASQARRIRIMIRTIARRGLWAAGRDVTAILEEDTWVEDLDTDFRTEQAGNFEAIAEMWLQAAALLRDGVRPEAGTGPVVTGEGDTVREYDDIPETVRLTRNDDGTFGHEPRPAIMPPQQVIL